MDGHPSIAFACRLIGVALILLSLCDVFMTVLYARIGTGPLSSRLARGGWALVRRVARRLPRKGKDTLLSFFGPSYLVALMATWITLMLLGFTLLAWAGLGSAIQATSGPTPHDFITAFYFAGGSLTTVGSSDLRAVSGFYKFVTVIDSVLGMSVLTLSVTYIVQIYTALQARNTLVLGLHHASGGTADAAELLAALGPGDDFSRGDSTLAAFAGQMTSVYESHHFYTVLIYFRFREAHYAMGRGTLLTMELLTLIDTVLDEHRHGWLTRSASVSQLRAGGFHVLAEMSGTLLPMELFDSERPTPATEDRWRRRYAAARRHLAEQGISVTDEPELGADRYVETRRRWDRYVMAFADYMEHPAEEIDPVGFHPRETGHHRELPELPVGAAG